jgi:O-glycosyl hydrolase
MRTFSLIIAVVLLNVQCNSQSEIEDKNEVVEIKINPEITFQTIDNFGASDAWSCQFVGKWPDEQKNRVADLLFSVEENADGTPKGIGLSCWRFNIGAGSADQKGEIKINDPWRRTECFLEQNETYNWEKQAGQRWFLQAAKQRGVESFVGFVNSPPVWLTKNGRANSDGGNSMNLPNENIAKFSEFLIEVTKNIQQNEGILFDYLSPVNEPQWDWKDGQEGSPWTNTEIAQFCRQLGNDLQKSELSTKISITDAGQLNHLYDRGNDAERGFQIREFFSKQSENYIGNVPEVASKIAGHSYFTTTNDKVLNEVRTKLSNEIEKIDPELEFWMSEYCILGDNDGFKGNGRDLGMETALFVANVIHADLTIANAGAWQWWLAVSPYNFKDGLVYIDKSETGGNIYESKLLWALGNYSRFIRPGAKRISAEVPENQDLKISAFRNENGDLVVVIVNRNKNDKNIQIGLPGNLKYDATIYETSESSSLLKKKNINLNESLNIPNQCIWTIVITS